ncbi:hypothetical protein Patl1_34926 [Pistacia atlantica]|uniref:Uncharacterized protein n=1 Tax=Pistacia atlantica TaxID=434234 RepID=A0ACC0ZPT3_9ROSI|nr:hypothetical protein Patl1_34926 [Pistacia atlantica]
MVAEEVLEPAVELIPMQPTIVGLQSTFDKVWKCLVGEEVEIMGIYGTGGVGKTTLLKQINNKFCNELQGFDVLIRVVVSRVPNFEHIQEDIGKKIGLNDESWKNKSLQEKAGDIFKILSSKDDIWNWIDLTEVGVPIPNSKFPSKVVFTTRVFEVCGSMKARKAFKVEYLRDEEAWKLFEENLQCEVLDHPDIPQLAKVVAKECGGLPLALVTVSRAISCKKTPQEWRYAANLLRNSASEFAGFPESKSFNISALATLKHLQKLRVGEWKGSDSNVGDVPKKGEPFSFKSFRNVKISNCNSLRDLTWIVFIPNLKFLYIVGCAGMKEIINIEKLGEVPEMMSDLIPFQKLQFLCLYYLKNLKSIFGKALPFRHLKEIEVVGCPELPLDANSAKEHKIVIEGQEEWWKELQWEDEATLNAFLPCFKSLFRKLS